MNAAPMASAYSTGEICPLRSRPTARASVPSVPLSTMIILPSTLYATRAIRVVVVVPVDGDEHEAQDVTEEHRDETGVDEITEDRDVCFAECRGAELQHHDGDDDGEHAIAEGFQPVRTHGTECRPRVISAVAPRRRSASPRWRLGW